jgi:pyruvate dehydrogenase E2 component (dihydrolipoamide acetyltransferase)
MSRLLNLPGDMAPATLRRWIAKPGQPVERNEPVCLAETDQAVLEIVASQPLTLTSILCPEGAAAEAGEPLAELEDGTSQPPDAPLVEVRPVEGEPGGAPENVSVVRMPKAGQTMEEGTVVHWLKAEGDPVAKDEPIFEVETDKAVIEVEAPAAGVLLKIIAQEGETVAVQAPAALVGPAGADVEAYAASLDHDASAAAPAPDTATQAAAAHSPAPPPTQPTAGERLFASPAARRRAAELGLDLATVGGSGKGGRIKAADVETRAAASTGPAREVEMTGMRTAIAKNLTFSKQTIPHWYATVSVDASNLIQAHRFLKQALGATLNALIIGATARTIAEFPELRCRWENDGIVELPVVNLGIAVGTDEGLRVPVLQNAAALSLAGIAQQARTLVEAARAGHMSQPAPASFTLTNLGMFGVRDFQAIINPPEAAILAVGAVREEPVVKNGRVAAGQVMSLTLSSDHRIVDGIVAARFLAKLKSRLEDVDSLLEELR